MKTTDKLTLRNTIVHWAIFLASVPGIALCGDKYAWRETKLYRHLFKLYRF